MLGFFRTWFCFDFKDVIEWGCDIIIATTKCINTNIYFLFLLFCFVFFGFELSNEYIQHYNLVAFKRPPLLPTECLVQRQCTDKVHRMHTQIHLHNTTLTFMYTIPPRISYPFSFLCICIITLTFTPITKSQWHRRCL